MQRIQVVKRGSEILKPQSVVYLDMKKDLYRTMLNTTVCILGAGMTSNIPQGTPGHVVYVVSTTGLICGSLLMGLQFGKIQEYKKRMRVDQR